MLLISCPYCQQERPELEFTYAGEAHLFRPDNPTDEVMRDFLFIRANPRGLHYERWRHTNGCGRYFNAVRHTVTDRFVCTYKAGLPRPDEDEINRLVKKGA